METTTRHPAQNEIPALHHIWTTAFGSGDETVFFDHYFDPGMCFVADAGAAPVAAGYVFPAGDLLCCGNEPVACAMIYAVSTLPDYRGLGYGTAIVRDLIEAGHSSGYPAIALCPSDDSLFGYYSARTGLRDWFYVREKRYDGLATDDRGFQAAEISVDEYIRLRECILMHIPHIKPNQHSVIYQKKLCELSGGGLFSIETPSGPACAIVERRSENTVWVKELLLQGKDETGETMTGAAIAIASAFPAEEYIVRTPAAFSSTFSSACGQELQDEGRLNKGVDDSSLFTHDNTDKPRAPDEKNAAIIAKRYGMLSAPAAILGKTGKNSSLPWLGLAFD